MKQFFLNLKVFMRFLFRVKGSRKQILPSTTLMITLIRAQNVFTLYSVDFIVAHFCLYKKTS